MSQLSPPPRVIRLFQIGLLLRVNFRRSHLRWPKIVMVKCLKSQSRLLRRPRDPHWFSVTVLKFHTQTVKFGFQVIGENVILIIFRRVFRCGGRLGSPNWAASFLVALGMMGTRRSRLEICQGILLRTSPLFLGI